MKKTIGILIIFILYTLIVNTYPIITLWDKCLIAFIQHTLSAIPLFIPLLPDCILYSIMIAVPIMGGSAYFFKEKKYLNILFLCSIPLITFLLNCIIKPLIHRQRPPYNLQLSIHPESFSYVSSHSLVTFCLWGMVILYALKHIANKQLKYSIITFSIAWILFVGFSRIWLGVHYPTDVLGAYILGGCLLGIYSRCIL